MYRLDSHKKETWLDTIWIALHTLDSNQISDEEWDDVCTAMAWVEEDLGFEINEDGDYIRIRQ